jgi:luciferase family oxidoreductase group 1
VLAGGMIGGILGPESSKFTRELFEPKFIGSYAVLVLFALLALVVIRRLDLPKASDAERTGATRPLAAIMRQPVFIVSCLGAVTSYAVMNLLMGATPLAMQMCGLPFSASTLVIESHIVGMFAPALFAGALVQRFGPLKIMACGVAAFALCVAAALAGEAVIHFWLASTLLGVGWCFLYVGASTLLGDACTAAEKAKTQGANDMFVFVCMGAFSLVSGAILEHLGWAALNYTAIPLIVASGVSIAWLGLRSRPPVPRCPSRGRRCGSPSSTSHRSSTATRRPTRSPAPSNSRRPPSSSATTATGSPSTTTCSASRTPAPRSWWRASRPRPRASAWARAACCCPYYSALKVAEIFRMLEALFPGRIDLGIGRAPGSDQVTSQALASGSFYDFDQFPVHVQDTVAFLDDALPADHPYARVKAMPSGPTAPEVWLLGSSGYSGSLAAYLGLRFAFANFISAHGGDDVMQAYRAGYRPSAREPVPQGMLTVFAICADTDAEAERLAAPIDLRRLQMARGFDAPVATTDIALAMDYSPEDRAIILRERARAIIGTPARVRDRIETLVEAYGADEVMVITITGDYGARLRSYELLAREFALPGA